MSTGDTEDTEDISTGDSEVVFHRRHRSHFSAPPPSLASSSPSSKSRGGQVCVHTWHRRYIRRFLNLHVCFCLARSLRREGAVAGGKGQVASRQLQCRFARPVLCMKADRQTTRVRCRERNPTVAIPFATKGITCWLQHDDGGGALGRLFGHRDWLRG